MRYTIKVPELKTLVLISIIGLVFTAGGYAEANQYIKKTLNNFHQAATETDSETYFNLLTDDAIFLGTDATERWTKNEFKKFVVPYFSAGKGWTYTPTQQNISLDSSGQYAFFDELLWSESYGQCRGSGVLRLTKDGWKIAQYNLSIPIPNSLAKEVVLSIKTETNMKEQN